MASSLKRLASYLNEADKFITRKHCDSMDEFKLLTKKGVFPYEYVDSWEKPADEQLPSKTDFYSKLNNENIPEQDYVHAIDV